MILSTCSSLFRQKLKEKDKKKVSQKEIEQFQKLDVKGTYLLPIHKFTHLQHPADITTQITT